MENTLDNYPERVNSLCSVCKHCKSNGGFFTNKASSSAVNILPSTEYMCKYDRFKKSHHKPYKYCCASFVEDKRKISLYIKK